MKAQVRPVMISTEADWTRVAAEYTIVEYHVNRFGDFVTCREDNGREFDLLLFDTLNGPEIRREFARKMA